MTRIACSCAPRATLLRAVPRAGEIRRRGAPPPRAGQRRARSASTCHMPAKTYMGCRSRRDHSFRVPRPDLSEAIGVPEHLQLMPPDRRRPGRPSTVAEWYPNGRQTTPALRHRAARRARRSLDAEPQLDALILDRTSPAIARAGRPAAAARLLTPAPRRRSGRRCDPDALVRIAVPRALPANLSPRWSKRGPAAQRPGPRRPHRDGAGARRCLIRRR